MGRHLDGHGKRTEIARRPFGVLSGVAADHSFPAGRSDLYPSSSVESHGRLAAIEEEC